MRGELKIDAKRSFAAIETHVAKPKGISVVEAAASIIEGGELDACRDARYAGWDGELGRQILGGEASLASLHERAMGRSRERTRRHRRRACVEPALA